MASISSYDSNSISTLFSSLNQTKSAGNNLNFGVNLSDYSMIKSGSYHKMMKAYYSTEGTGAVASGKGSTSTSKDTTKTLAAVENSADDLMESAKDLYKSGSKGIFNKKEVTDENGKTSEQYDTDKIYEAVKTFVSDYNSLVSAAGSSKTSSIANTAAAMVNFTKINSKSLSSLGITMDGKDYSLSLNEETFKKADMSVAKSLFHGNGSYGYQTALKASMLKNYAQNESTKANTYGANGTFTYNYSTGELYNSIT